MFDNYSQERETTNAYLDDLSDEEYLENEDVMLMPYKAMCSDKLYAWFAEI